MKFQTLNESFNKLYGLTEDCDDIECCDVPEEDEELDEGILDDIKSAYHTRMADYHKNKAGLNISADSPTKSDIKSIMKAREHAQKQYKHNLKAAIASGRSNAQSVRDEIKSKGDAIADYNKNTIGADEDHNRRIDKFLNEVEQDFQSASNVDELDGLFDRYVSEINKNTPGGLTYSDPIYKKLKSIYTDCLHKVSKE